MTDNEISIMIAKRLMNIPAPMRDWCLANVAGHTFRRWCLQTVNGKDDKGRPIKLESIIKPIMDGAEELGDLEKFELEYEKNPAAIDQKVLEVLSKFGNGKQYQDYYSNLK